MNMNTPNPSNPSNDWPAPAQLTLRALGRLAPEEQARVDAALESDAALRAEYDRIAQHMSLWTPLEATAPPPAFTRLALHGIARRCQRRVV